MKVLYVIDSLASKGGAERILTEKMNYLVSRFGYEVTVVTCHQNVDTLPNTYDLLPQVRQVNLCIPFYVQYKVGYPRRFFVKLKIRRQLVHDLTACVLQEDPDILIGVSYFDADIVCGIPCRAKKIIESHDARPFTLQRQGLSRYWFSDLYMKWFRRRYFSQIEQRADVVVTLTQGDALEWNKAKRVTVIPNFSIMPVTAFSTGEEKRVLAIGRLEWQKGFDLLIDAWTIISPQHLDWRLDIIGTGMLEEDLKRRISDAGLTNVQIHPFTSQISKEYARSSLFVLSSRFEGFSLVLLEAMRHGVPCVSFDCPYGPSDVLVDGISGLLANNDDSSDLAAKMGQLMGDNTLRKRMATAAIERAKTFNVDEIMQKWKILFKSLKPQSA